MKVIETNLKRIKTERVIYVRPEVITAPNDPVNLQE